MVTNFVPAQLFCNLGKQHNDQHDQYDHRKNAEHTLSHQ